MDAQTLLRIIGDDDLTEDDAEILLQRAVKKAVNHHWWGENDIPTDDEIEAFKERYEFEIYDVAKAISADAGRDGEISHTELGITRVWDKAGNDAVESSLSAIPTKTYVWSK